MGLIVTLEPLPCILKTKTNPPKVQRRRQLHSPPPGINHCLHFDIFCFPVFSLWLYSFKFLGHYMNALSFFKIKNQNVTRKAQVHFHLHWLSQVPAPLPRESHSYELGMFIFSFFEKCITYIWIYHSCVWYVANVILWCMHYSATFCLNIFWALCPCIYRSNLFLLTTI